MALGPPFDGAERPYGNPPRCEHRCDCDCHRMRGVKHIVACCGHAPCGHTQVRFAEGHMRLCHPDLNPETGERVPRDNPPDCTHRCNCRCHTEGGMHAVACCHRAPCGHSRVKNVGKHLKQCHGFMTDADPAR